jgi:hypothetical protein
LFYRLQIDRRKRPLLWLSLGDIPASPAVQWDRAHVQTILGTREVPAARCLACQILIDGRLPWPTLSPRATACAGSWKGMPGCHFAKHVIEFRPGGSRRQEAAAFDYEA